VDTTALCAGSARSRLSNDTETSVIEDPLDDGGVLGWSGAEVPGRGVDGGVAEEGLDLGGVGPALAEPRAGRYLY
jgi:hypothetical protein